MALLQDTSYIPPPDIQKLVFSSLATPKGAITPPTPDQLAINKDKIKATTNDEKKLAQKKAELDAISAAFNGYAQKVATIAIRYSNEIGTPLKEIAAAQDVRDSLVATIDDRFVAVSSPAACQSAAEAIVTQVNDPISGAITRVATALGYTWPPDDTIASDIKDVDTRRRALADLKGLPGWKDWYIGGNRIAYDDLVQECELLKQRYSAATSDGTLFKDYSKQVVAIKDFSIRLNALKSDGTPTSMQVAAQSFSRNIKVDCAEHFGKTKVVSVKIAGTDEGIPDKDKAGFNREVVKVVCPPRITASYGIGTAFQEERHYAIVQTKSSDPVATTAVKRFDADILSREKLMLSYLAHLRWRNAPYFLTVGPTFGFESGVDPGLFYGASYSFDDAAYISAGWSILRQSSLIGGFSQGDTVPSDVTSAPTRKSWHTGFSMLFSFPVGGASSNAGSGTKEATDLPTNGAGASTAGGAAATSTQTGGVVNAAPKKRKKASRSNQ